MKKLESISKSTIIHMSVNKLQVKENKTALMVVGRKGGTRESPISILVGQSSIQECETCKILVVHAQRDVKWNIQTQELRTGQNKGLDYLRLLLSKILRNYLG